MLGASCCNNQLPISCFKSNARLRDFTIKIRDRNLIGINSSEHEPTKTFDSMILDTDHGRDDDIMINSHDDATMP